MKSVEIKRPFKVSIDNLLKLQVNDGRNSLLSELSSSVFNKRISINIFNKELFEEHINCNISEDIINRYIVVKRNLVTKTESQIANSVKDHFNNSQLDIVNIEKIIKDDYKEIQREIDIYQNLIAKLSKEKENYILIKDIYIRAKKDFTVRPELIKDYKKMGSTVKRVLSSLPIVSTVPIQDIVPTVPIQDTFNNLSISFFHLVIKKNKSLTENEFEQLKKYMMLAYSVSTKKLKQYSTDVDKISKEYSIKNSVVDKNDVLLCEFLNNNYPEEWFENQYSINVEQVNIDLPKIFYDLLYSKLDFQTFEKVLNLDYMFGIRNKVIEILSKHNCTFDELHKVLQKDLENKYLNIDKIRSNMTSLPKSVLSDPNKGDWEVYEDALINNWLNTNNSEDFYFFARNPKLDINRNAVCAIDFGTKSTVVAIRDKDERLLRIGNGNSYSDLRKEDFENPTFLYFQDFKEFNKDYKKRIGRPFTKWRDVLVSHEAASKFYDEIDDEKSYYATFNELKQWANTKNRHQILIDKSGNRVKLNSYLNLTSKDTFDPIELYAYYLGLYINNYNNGIYLHYTLSFPVEGRLYQ